MSHVTHMNGSRHNYECGMSHIQMHLWQDSFICHELYHLSRTKLISNAACHINKCSMSCTWIRYVAHVTRLIHMSRTLSSITNETHIIWYFLYVNSTCRAYKWVLSQVCKVYTCILSQYFCIYTHMYHLIYLYYVHINSVIQFSRTLSSITNELYDLSVLCTHVYYQLRQRFVVVRVRWWSAVRS